MLDDGVLVKNHYSCVSAGTEKTMIELGKKNVVNKARERPDLAKKVFEMARNDGLVSTYQNVMARLEEATPLGYSCCGEVIEVGENVTEFSEGDMVACAGAGYANHAEVVSVPRNLCAPVPDGVEPSNAAFVTIGAIAMQGIRRADLSPGERVAVLGLGLVGQTVVQILNAYGFPVLAVDIAPGQVETALDLGADKGAVIGDDDIEQVAEHFSEGNGVDATVIAASTKSNQPVEQAGEITREQGRVSVIGQVGMDVPRELYYEKELDFLISRSYGPGRYDKQYEEKGLDYPIEHVRWTENRNMRECLRLLATGRLDFEPMQTHEFEIDSSTDAYDLILENPNDEAFTGVLLKYAPDREHSTTLERTPTATPTTGTQQKSAPLAVGMIGVGNFAKGTLLPIIEDIKALDLRAVASATGVSASQVAAQHDCSYSTTDYRQIVEDNAIDIVVIATRHNLHAEIATAALEQGKDVHVEKPLAISEEGLQQVATAARDAPGRLMVGFNRRFAEPTRQLKKSVCDGPGPVMLNYRVNADSIPEDHWIHDPEIGGGRVVGEVCHFVDFARFVADSPIEQVYATGITNESKSVPPENVDVTLEFENGSTASVLYTTLGDSSLPKEHVEAFGNGRASRIDNFKGGRMSLGQDKGHEREFKSLVKSILAGERSAIALEAAIEVTESTFAIHESLRRGEPIPLTIDTYL
ncbi:bi-domain-containing oxidoreductase [Halomarina litorea]|uniref:bi-domain-containing oxidoreductase n=1 Tax=Halomarina litorea TaxID=2961595 RepID=UPI0020C1DD68|nr:bi-domain-containing oxidoreductase [Halomarina sp. BCD28]